MKNTSQTLAPSSSTPSRTAGVMRLAAAGINAVRGRRAGIALHAPPPHV